MDREEFETAPNKATKRRYASMEVRRMLDDLLDQNLKLVICGTAAGNTSASQQEYYASTSNKFWSVLDEVGLTPQRLTTKEYPKLLEFGIGLTDVVKGQSGNDQEIDFSLANTDAIRKKIAHYSPLIFAFNGKNAAKIFLNDKVVEYGVHAKMVGSTKLFIAPNTSNSANGSWDPKYWHSLASLVHSGDA